MLDLFFSAPQLDRADFACSLSMMLVMEGARKEKKGFESLFLFLFLKNLVDLLKLPVATAPCKRICVEYTTFARKRLIAYVYDLCARGDLCVRCTSVRVKQLNAYV